MGFPGYAFYCKHGHFVLETSEDCYICGCPKCPVCGSNEILEVALFAEWSGEEDADSHPPKIRDEWIFRDDEDVCGWIRVSVFDVSQLQKICPET